MFCRRARKVKRDRDERDGFCFVRLAMTTREDGNVGRKQVPAARFYSEYHGHRVDHLKILLPRLREASDSLIWTAGDSSLDNKYWYDTDLLIFVTRRCPRPHAIMIFPRVIGSMIRNQPLEAIVMCSIHQCLNVM